MRFHPPPIHIHTNVKHSVGHILSFCCTDFSIQTSRNNHIRSKWSVENPGFPGVKAEVTFLFMLCLVIRQHSKKYSEKYGFYIERITQQEMNELLSGVCKWLPYRHHSLGGTKIHSHMFMERGPKTESHSTR